MERDRTIDVMRGIAIILVVIDHAGGKWGVINFFHVPLFFFISGCFFKPLQDYSIAGLLKQFKWRATYIPFIKYGIIFLLLSPILYKLHLSNTYHEGITEWRHTLFLILRFRTTMSDMLGQFWFLPALFFAHALCLTIHIFSTNFSKYIQILIFAGIYFIGMICFINGIKEPYDFSRIMYLSFFYAMGFYSYKYMKYVYQYWQFPLLSFILLQTFCQYSYLVFSNAILFLLFALMGIVMTAWLSNHIGKRLTPILSFIGKHTMIVFIWHVLIIKITQMGLAHLGYMEYYSGWRGNMEANDYWWIFTLISIFTPITITIILKKLQTINMNKYEKNNNESY